MKRNTRILLGLAAIATLALITYGVKKQTSKRMLKEVADEGYETAHDVLFPRKSTTGKRQHYGPILPG